MNRTTLDCSNIKSISPTIEEEKIKIYQEKTKEYLNKLDNIIKSRRDLA